MAKCPACGNPITKNKEGRRGCKRHGPIYSPAEMEMFRAQERTTSLARSASQVA